MAPPITFQILCIDNNPADSGGRNSSASESVIARASLVYDDNAVTQHGPLAKDSRYGIFKQMLLAVVHANLEDVRDRCSDYGPSFAIVSESARDGPVYTLTLWTGAPDLSEEQQSILAQGRGFSGRLHVPLTSYDFPLLPHDEEWQWLRDDGTRCWTEDPQGAASGHANQLSTNKSRKSARKNRRNEAGTQHALQGPWEWY